MFIGLSVGQPDNFLIRGVFLIKKILNCSGKSCRSLEKAVGSSPERMQGISGSLFP